jgi:molecular chaperone HscB
MSNADNYFALFDLSVSFEVDLTVLAQRYRALQSAVHPDRFANASPSEKRLAMERTVLVNDGYRALKDSVARAMYLLKLKGIDGLDERNTHMPPDFLMEQMELRESIEEAQGDEAALDDLTASLRKKDRILSAEFVEAVESNMLDVATVTARKMRFNQKLQQEIEEQLAALDL